MRFIYLENLGDNWSRFGDGFKEQQKTLYLYALKRTFSISWIWAIDPFGRKCTTPFDGRMNCDWIKWRVGYLQFYMSKKY